MASKQTAVDRGRADLVKAFPGLIPEEESIPYARITKELTPSMRMIELLTGKSIQEVLSRDKKGVDVARQLGITPQTVSRWRQTLGIKV